ncbi:MAG: hypothetical protein EXX96DRAFT_563498 [Benjaminiella poitrasii]|nr:MAG: hypothetical protein EXX96DRAFT_563498 [Benjaminiella poitrasii]
MKIISLTTVVATLLTSVFARSSVHITSNEKSSLTSQPEISLNAFSMFYSHIMDSSSSRPAFLRLQDSNAQMGEVETISPLFPQSNDLFEKKVDGNLVVIISGVNAPEDYDASFYVSDDTPENYVSLVEETVDEIVQNNHDVGAILYKNEEAVVKYNMESHKIVTPQFEKEDLVYNFNKDFADFYTEVFDINKEVDRKFITEVEMIKDLTQNESNMLKVIQVESLKALAQEYGMDSKQYKEGELIMKELVEKSVIPNFQAAFTRGISVMILTPYKQEKNCKRDVKLSALAAEGVSCYKTLESCRNSTSDCSGHGQCTKVQEKKDCYVCQCQQASATKKYIGDSCQYIDAVGDFQLLFWTSVLLIVITASVVVCVYQSGNIVDGGIIMTQSLPKQD